LALPSGGAFKEKEMSNKFGPNGSVLFTAAVGEYVSAYSLDRVKVYGREVGGTAWELLFATKAGQEDTSDEMTEPTEIRIDSGGFETYYAVGTTALVSDRKGLRGQGDPETLDVTGDITGWMIIIGLITSTTAAAVVATVPTGAVMAAALDLKDDESVDWSVINTGGNAFTVTAAASGHTVVGAGAVAAGTSGVFRTRKTDTASTFVTYRVG
jgi:hypothetical protein